MISPTLSFPVSLIKVTLTPKRPNEIIPLKTEPPGTAAVGWLSLKEYPEWFHLYLLLFSFLYLRFIYIKPEHK